MASTNTAPSANAPAPTANAPAQNASKSANAVPAAPVAASGGFFSGLTSFLSGPKTVPCKCPTCGNDHTRPAPAAQTGAGRRSRRNRKNRKNSRKNNNSRKD